jgi:hypothetical protein
MGCTSHPEIYQRLQYVCLSVFLVNKILVGIAPSCTALAQLPHWNVFEDISTTLAGRLD